VERRKGEVREGGDERGDERKGKSCVMAVVGWTPLNVDHNLRAEL